MKLPDLYILMCRNRRGRDGPWVPWRPNMAHEPEPEAGQLLDLAKRRQRPGLDEYRVIKIPGGEYEVIGP